MNAPRHPSFDSPLDNPQHDRLEITQYAKHLAQFLAAVKTPFTIGVYGAWGSGKTTFVQFLEAELKKTAGDPIEFIAFQAWPFKTSDDLWRALVQEIARRLYGIAPPPPVEAPPPAPEPLTQRLGALLQRPFMVFDPPRADRTPEYEYHDLLSRLDETLYGGVRQQEAAVLNDEAAMTAAVQGTLAALGSMSPLIAAMRTFFGFDARPDVTRLLQREQNAATRRRIQSVAQFKAALADVFEKCAPGKRVCVFVDDLDRCMPDVALDLLEALKIFLGNVPCLFIVAADEQLIGEGLRLRYRDLVSLAPTRATQRLFAQKGKEYFEKIIQLSIRVTDHASKDPHPLIAAQFPQWVPTTDLIRTAVGTNPRRLKQYCTELTYKHMVRPAQAAPVVADPRLLDKLIELQSWSATVVKRLRTLADDPATYKETLQKLETCVADSKPGEARKQASDEIGNKVAHEIYGEAVMSAPLRQLFTAEPRLSEFDPALIKSLASIVDVKPAGVPMLASEDRTMMRILQSETALGKISALTLLVDDLAHLFVLEAEDAAIVEPLTKLARESGWNEQMFAVESVFEGKPAKLSEPAKALADQAKQNNRLRLRFLQPPRLSTTLADVVTGWSAVREQIPLVSPSDPAEQLTPAGRASLALEKIENRKEIEEALELRLRAARYFIALRKFVKLDALSHAWPELAERLRTDNAGVRDFESKVIDRDQRERELPKFWQTFLRDERLLEFLHLRPYLKDFLEHELPEYSKFIEAAVPPPSVTPPTTPAPVPAPPPSLLESQRYNDLAIRVTHVEEDRYNVALNSEGVPAALTAEVTIDPSRIGHMLEMMERLPFEWTSTFTIAAQNEMIAMQQMRQSAGAARAGFPLREIGHELYAWFFRGNKLTPFIDPLLLGNVPQRLRIDVPPELMRLPWEALYAPPLQPTFLGLTRRYSIVRQIGAMNAPPAQARLFSPPLRVVALFAGPRDVAQLKLQQEEDLLLRVLAPSIESGMVAIDVLHGTDATYANMNQLLRMRQPHVFHFSGHGFYEEGGEGALILDENGHAKVVLASDMAVLLHDSNVAVAVLSGCDTGRASRADMATSVAGALTRAGIPAVIATTRQIMDDAGLLFTREFYRALADRFTVEASLIEARKAMSVEKWDWSAFAFFTSGANLDELRLESLRTA